MTAESALEQSRRCKLATVSLEQPFAWLRLGWHDLQRAPLPGLLHGVADSAFGLV